MKKRELKYRSCDGLHEVYGIIWSPAKDEDIRGIFQISHGMCEYAERYNDFAQFLAGKNYLVCANDHLGHGATANGDFGYMGAVDGYKNMIEDMHTLSIIVKDDYKNIPYFLLGHSMGSFLTRSYISQYGKELSGVLISGTGLTPKGFGLIMLFTKLMIKFKRSKKPAFFLALGMGGIYNKRFKPCKTHLEWLTRDEKIKERTATDKKFTFVFTYSGYLDLFNVLKEVSKKEWAETVPKKLPIYIFSGSEDPVGNYSADIAEIYNRLKYAGCENLTLKVYKNGRHEMLNEINRSEVYEDIITWLEKIACKRKSKDKSQN